MPFRWVEPEVFLDCLGIKVYRTYRHQMECDGPSDFIFTTDESADDRDGDSEFHFDVRDLCEELGMVQTPDDPAWKRAVIFEGFKRQVVPIPEEVIFDMLAEKLEDSDLLLELVHDVASRAASNVNNSGPVEQLRYLAENMGFKEMQVEVQEILDRSNGVK